MEEVIEKMQAPTSIKSGDDRLHELVDNLITGNVHWPCASIAISDTEDFLTRMSERDQEWVFNFAKELGAVPSHMQRSALEAVERDERETFRRVLKALYEAYYTSPRVIERVKAFAMSGPNEPSPIFEGSLVQNVIRTQAGKRRL
jgi:hypothetical protein